MTAIIRDELRLLELPVVSRAGFLSAPGQGALAVQCRADDAVTLGIPGMLLFGVPSRKDASGSESFAPDGIIQRAVAAVKDRRLPRPGRGRMSWRPAG